MTKTISNEVIIYLITYLNPIVLAIWAMDDGSPAGKSGFYLHTEGFTFDETYKLVGLLHYNFGLYCTVQKHAGKPVIYITAKSLEKNSFTTFS